MTDAEKKVREEAHRNANCYYANPIPIDAPKPAGYIEMFDSYIAGALPREIELERLRREHEIYRTMLIEECTEHYPNVDAEEVIRHIVSKLAQSEDK